MISAHPDLWVVGGGIVGAAIACEATQAGLRVGLVSASTPGVAGATAAGMGHLVTLDEPVAERALCVHSLALWEDWVHEPGAEFSRCGTLWLAETEAELTELSAKRRRLAEVGVPTEELAGRDLPALEPLLRTGLAGALRAPRDAVVYAPRVARTLVQRAQARGALLHIGTPVAEVGAGTVRLADGRVLQGGAVVVAAGLASGALLLGLRFTPRKGQLVITDRYPGQLRHQVVEVGYGASAHGSGASVAFNVSPRPTGQILVGSSRQPGAADTAIDAPLLGRMLTRAFAFMPALAQLTALRSWAGVRPGTPDGQPYIGAMPGRPGLWVAAGHEGLGITTALGTARLLVQMLRGVTPDIDMAPYAPGRA